MMKIQEIQAAAKANFSRHNPKRKKGFYESYFIRANHPTEKKAFWIRYTLLAPQDQSHPRKGELWGIYFDGEKQQAFKEEFALEDCNFASKYFGVSLGKNKLNHQAAKGKINEMSWNLSYQCQQKPLFLLPLAMYLSPMPKAKTIVSQPLAIFSGELKIGSETIAINQWQGSQNHNWGEKHTDHYAWGQVAGFDNSNDTFLEIITAQLEIGKVNTPFLTLLVLRHEGKEYQFNHLSEWVTNKASFDYFHWEFECKNKNIQIKGKIEAQANDFVGLCYANPSGKHKNCLNTKVASCQLEIKKINQKGMPVALYTKHRCAFEILTNQEEIHHGIKINF